MEAQLVDGFLPILPVIGSGTGWAAFLGLAIYVVRGYVTGNTLTRREGDGITRRAEKAEASRDSLIAQNNELMEMARLGQNTFAALRQAAEQAAEK